MSANGTKSSDAIYADISIVKAEICRIRNDIDKLLKIIVEGNGHSLVSKMAVVETKILANDEYLKKIESSALATKIAVLTAVLSFCASMGMLIFELVVKGNSK